MGTVRWLPRLTAAQRHTLQLISTFPQRFPTRDSHGSAADDVAGTETQSDKNAMLYYHKLGTQQCTCTCPVLRLGYVSLTDRLLPRNAAEDVLVYKDEAHPEWMWGTEITELDGRYLLLSVRRDTSRVRTEHIGEGTR